MCRLRINLFSSIMRQEVAFFDVNRTGELTNRLSEDVRTTRADQGRPTADYSLHLTCIALNAPLQRSVGCLQREGHVPPPTTCMAVLILYAVQQWHSLPSFLLRQCSCLNLGQHLLYLASLNLDCPSTASSPLPHPTTPRHPSCYLCTVVPHLPFPTDGQHPPHPPRPLPVPQVRMMKDAATVSISMALRSLISMVLGAVLMFLTSWRLSLLVLGILPGSLVRRGM